MVRDELDEQHEKLLNLSRFEVGDIIYKHDIIIRIEKKTITISPDYNYDIKYTGIILTQTLGHKYSKPNYASMLDSDDEVYKLKDYGRL